MEDIHKRKLLKLKRFYEENNEDICLNEWLIKYIIEGKMNLIYLFMILMEPNLNELTKSKQTPLHFASLNETENSVEIIELFLNNGANIDIKDGNNWTPIHYAIYTGNKEALELYKNKKLITDEEIIKFANEIIYFK